GVGRGGAGGRGYGGGGGRAGVRPRSGGEAGGGGQGGRGGHGRGDTCQPPPQPGPSLLWGHSCSLGSSLRCCLARPAPVSPPHFFFCRTDRRTDTQSYEKQSRHRRYGLRVPQSPAPVTESKE